jgi:hypothetical protein
MGIVKSTIIVLSALTLFISSSAFSATVTYSYTATVTGSGVGVSGIIVGDTVTGTLSYSDNYPASTFTTTSSIYDATGAVLTMNGASAGLDVLGLSNSNAVPDRFDIFDSSIVADYAFGLSGTNALIQDATIIPLDLDFNEVFTSQVIFKFVAGSGFGEGVVTAGLDNFQVVPIPGAVWLFGSGLLGLIGISRRKKFA